MKEIYVLTKESWTFSFKYASSVSECSHSEVTKSTDPYLWSKVSVSCSL